MLNKSKLEIRNTDTKSIEGHNLWHTIGSLGHNEDHLEIT